MIGNKLLFEHSYHIFNIAELMVHHKHTFHHSPYPWWWICTKWRWM